MLPEGSAQGPASALCVAGLGLTSGTLVICVVATCCNAADEVAGRWHLRPV